MPKRIQLSRRKGWRKPAGTVVVARGTRWGNPFRVDEYGRAEALRRYRDYLSNNSALQRDIRTHLAGKDLACWCRPDQDCHADLLLAIANSNGNGNDRR